MEEGLAANAEIDRRTGVWKEMLKAFGGAKVTEATLAGIIQKRAFSEVQNLLMGENFSLVDHLKASSDVTTVLELFAADSKDRRDCELYCRNNGRASDLSGEWEGIDGINDELRVVIVRQVIKNERGRLDAGQESGADVQLRKESVDLVEAKLNELETGRGQGATRDANG